LAIDEGGEMADLVQADSHCQEALATFREVDYLPGIIRALHGLAYVSYKLRDFARSLSLTHELLNLAWTHQRPVYDYLDDIADIAGRIGQPEVAARLYGAAMAERRRHGSVLPPVFQAEFEDDLAVALRALGEEQFEAAWEAGGAMAVELAVAEALAFTATGLTSLQVSLTPREQQILPLLAEGKTAREIGAILFLSHRTVENHIANLCSKLGVRTRAEAVEVALAGGLITPGSDAQLGNQPSEIE
jgi:DNA-binding CsgD family transcriptional regulator